MKSLKVTGQKRENLGKKDAKKLRGKEMVPGVLYGKDKVIHLAVPFSELRQLIYTPNVYLIDLELDGEMFKAMVQDIQWHPVEEKALHIDFLKIDEDKPLKIDIPINLIGMAKGTRAGGRLRSNLRKLRVQALAADLPDSIDIDITKLGIGDSIKIEDLKYENLKFLDLKSSMIVSVISSRAALAAMALPEDEEEEEAGEEGETSESAEGSEAAETSEQ